MIQFDEGLLLQHVVERTFQIVCCGESNKPSHREDGFHSSSTSWMVSKDQEDACLNVSSFSLIYLDHLVPSLGQKQLNSNQQLEKAIIYFVDTLIRALCSREWKMPYHQFINVLSSRVLFVKDRQQFSLVHLACDTNRVNLLEWIQLYSSDNLRNDNSVNSNTVNRNVNNTMDQNCLLWSVKDSNGLEPLFYAVNSGAKDCVAFLCSQKSVREEQLNLRRDCFGNLPIVSAFKRRDYEMCDLLQLFGAQIDLSGGLTFGMGVQESLMHYAMRKKDIQAVRYLALHSSKTILKKNHRGEIPLFHCLKDKRGMFRDSEEEVTTTNFGGKGGCDGCAVTVPSHVYFLSTILEEGKTLFGQEQFHKALLSKNGFGRNILMESIVMNDLEVTRVICNFLLSRYGFSAASNMHLPAGGGDSGNLNFLKQLIHDRDLEDSTIFHIAFRYIGCYLSITNSTIREIFKLLKELFAVTQPSKQSLKDFMKSNPSKYHKLSSGSKSISKSINLWIKLE